MVLIPAYEPRLFVNRSSETNLVTAKLKDLLAGRRVKERTVIFVGEYGMGKSWLLRRLHDVLLRQIDEPDRKRVRRLFIDLEEFDRDDPAVAVMAILHRAGYKLFKEELPGATLAEMSRAFVERLRTRLKNSVLVVFVDGVYRSRWELLAPLEEYLLGPLAIEPHVLIVLDSRKRGYPWRTPELRTKAEFVELSPFDEKQTKDQIAHIIEKSRLRIRRKALFPLPMEIEPFSEKVYKLSKGHPLTTYLFATLDREPEEVLDEVINEMLVEVPPAERPQIRQFLEALCVLRAFDEDRIPPMLAVYFQEIGDEEKAEGYKNWGYKEARELRRKLVKWELAFWDDERGGFVIPEPLRRLLLRFLIQERREVWDQLQRRAQELYEEWEEKYPKTKERWVEEKDYHVKCLNDPDYALNEDQEEKAT